MVHGALKELMIRASALLGLSNKGAGPDAPPGDRAMTQRAGALEPAIHRLETLVQDRQRQLRSHRHRRDGTTGH